MITREWAEAHIDAGVVYRAYENAKPEEGRIVRVTARGVFVAYRSVGDAQLTSFADLEPMIAS